MPKLCYVTRNFSDASLNLIQHANDIIEEYTAQGYELTLRQLYYQFVSRDLIPNTQKSYKNLGSVINDGRLAGYIDWLAIVDRTRNLQSNSHWESPSEIVETCVRSFQIDKWENQKIRPEVWIEKDALVGVIENVCSRNDVAYFSCRGYTSQSELWVAGQRLLKYYKAGQTPCIIHLGDHDPSGIDMTRDILDRIRMFTNRTIGSRGGASLPDVEVFRIALNMDQVRKYKPPPNPAKITDSRATKYIKKFGQSSWELDALEPKILDKLIETTIHSLRDERLWKRKLKEEKGHRATLQQVADDLDKGK